MKHGCEAAQATAQAAAAPLMRHAALTRVVPAKTRALGLARWVFVERE